MKRVASSVVSGVMAAMLTSGAWAQSAVRYYEVTITNAARGESFTPLLVSTHGARSHLFQVGHAPRPELAALAEGGDTVPMANLLTSGSKTVSTATSMGLLAPGKSVTVKVAAKPGADRLSVAAMLIPTNDAFVALNAIKLPTGWGKVVHWAPAYDAGSEPNDELCVSIPGPACGGAGGSPEASGEGFVHVHAGIHGIGDLSAAEYDWRNPVAEISIRRVTW